MIEPCLNRRLKEKPQNRNILKPLVGEYYNFCLLHALQGSVRHFNQVFAVLQTPGYPDRYLCWVCAQKLGVEIELPEPEAKATIQSEIEAYFHAYKRLDYAELERIIGSNRQAIHQAVYQLRRKGRLPRPGVGKHG